ncbi:MAG: hypothetical protein JNL74_10915 [Fibrobacteres bacterium]|nr:hypothetical protein [Fibrobacterota bacterium]
MNSFSVVFILSIICFATSIPQSYASIINTAESFDKIGDYEAAASEYRRILYHFPEADSFGNIRGTLSNMLIKCSKYNEALEIIRTINIDTMNDSLKQKCLMQQALILILTGQHNNAIDLIQKTKTEQHQLLGFCYIELNNWDRAKEEFTECFRTDTIALKTYNKWLQENKPPHFKNPKAAKMLSIFVPGLGQVYNGNYADGINAAAVNFGSGYATVQSLLSTQFVDAGLLGMLFYRFYKGNISNAVAQTDRANTLILNNYRIKYIHCIKTIMQ